MGPRDPGAGRNPLSGACPRASVLGQSPHPPVGDVPGDRLARMSSFGLRAVRKVTPTL